MKPAIAILFALATLCGVSEAKKIVCYYASWAVYYSYNFAVNPEDLDATLCTHINYAFVTITDEGGLKTLDEWADVQNSGFKRVVALKKKNSALKVLLSIGGPTAFPETFAAIAADPNKRASMVGSAKWFVQNFGFDGVDIDWEVPTSSDKANFVSLLQDFKNEFSNNGWLVSCAVTAQVADGYDVAQISNIVEHINVKAFDFYGPWSNYTGQSSALWASSVESDSEKNTLNMDAAIRLWRAAGASPSKLIAGIPFSGHSFSLRDPNSKGLHAPSIGAGEGGPQTQQLGSWAYFEYCENKQWKCDWDGEQKMLMCTKGNQWLGMEDEGSVRNKVSYINTNDLGGAMVWTIDLDDIHGKCGKAKAMLHAIKDNLN